ncbi:sugar phosphate isomerase/epimerase family protein [Paractinoplanes maris]|uniref:sugar phosphate isomerase/epimerase family protein n=1 Tax=Paractinoplanes maris TaxID=1734446 RepID=UPI002020EA2B|nr:TIM barrel protein [Actinoplanes maris]
MTVRPGLLSVTLRHLTPEEVVAIAADAGLAAVEWGGDIHVPHGDLDAAARVAALTTRAGLEVSAYGSYYRLGHSDDQEAVVATAIRLGAPAIRVWAGRQGSASAGAAYRARVRDDALRLAGLAGDIGIVLEYHRDTLTDTRMSTAALLDDVRGAGVRSLWQPQPERSPDENAGDLRALLPDLANLHVFAWNPDRSRLPLAAHRDRWAAWLAVAAEAPGDRFASLEFVPGDDPAQVRTDAATLRAVLPRPGEPGRGRR